MVNNWKMWCRLCAHEGPNNMDINLLPSQSNIADGLNHYFSINISDADNLGSMICFNCQEALERIIEFGSKVSRVQKMFLELLNDNGEIDPKQLKVQYKIDDEAKEKSMQITPIDKLYEPQINLSANNTAIDLLKTTNIKIETSDDDKVDAENWTNQELTLENKHSINKAPSCEPDIKTLTEKANDYKQSTDQKLQNNNNTAVCSECKKLFRSLNSMRRHLKKQHGLTTRILRSKGPFICEKCGKICKSHGALDEHKLVHVEDRPFKCRMCEKSFKNKRRLQYHEDTHSTTSYVCSICGIRLNSKATLNQHMLVHSNQKRQKCDYCGNEYKRAKALKTHLILHTGLKPYTCDFCDRTFANGSNCRSHKKNSHPVEFAAMEAAGKVTSYTKVPELKDLRASLLSKMEIQND